jgi:hypothetical protein
MCRGYKVYPPYADAVTVDGVLYQWVVTLIISADGKDIHYTLSQTLMAAP